MEAKKLVKRRPIGRRVAQGVVVLTLLSTLSICLFSYYIYRANSMEKHTNRAKDIAIAVAAAIDVQQFTESLAGDFSDDYWYQVKAYLDTVKTNTGLEYLYIITLHDAASNVYQYYSEGMKPGDNPAEIGQPGYIEYDPTVFPQEALIAIQTAQPLTAAPYYAEEYGHLTTGFAPIIGMDGNAIAIVGADINVSETIESANQFAIVIVSASLFFSLVFAFLSERYIKYLVGYSLRRVTDGTRLLSEGDLTFRARANDSDDNVGRLYANFAKVISTFKMLIDDMNSMSALHADGEYTAHLDESKYTGAYLEVVKGINKMTFMYVNNFNELLDVVKSYGNGNFAANVNKYPGKLAEGNKIVDELRDNLINVSNEINTLAETALSGNLSVRAKTEGLHGEWSKIIVNLNNLMDAFVRPIQESAGVLQELSEGRLDVKMVGEYKGDFSLIKDNLNKTVGELADYIGEIQTSLDAVAKNDLTVDINKHFKGDFAAIEKAIQSIIADQSDFFEKVGEIAEFLGNHSIQLANSSQQMSEIVDEQTNTVGQLTSTVSVVNSQAHDNAQNAGEADDISNASMRNANSGDAEMKNMLLSMEEIMIASNDIANIIKTIDDISSQTNLLALNAAVEAARAGEHGKGFAVVAEEVRNLAARSQNAAKQTQELIDGTICKINTGVNLAKSTSDILITIVNHVTTCSNLVSKIAQSSTEQASSVTLVTDGIKQISSTIQNSMSVAEENTATSIELERQSEVLNELMGSVKLKKKGHTTKA